MAVALFQAPTAAASPFTARYNVTMSGKTDRDTAHPSDAYDRTFSEWLRLSMRAVPAFLMWLPVVIAVPLAALVLFSTPSG